MLIHAYLESGYPYITQTLVCVHTHAHSHIVQK